MSKHVSLNQKIVWITGASSGIGESLVFELAKRGARVMLTARRQTELERICDEVKAQQGEAHAFAGDVRNLDQMRKIATQIEDSIGPIDIVVSNAGSHLFTLPEKFDSNEYIQLMDLNYGGMLRVAEATVPSMIARKCGRFVGVASLAGYCGLPRAAAYGASKAAQIHFLESIRYHLEEYGVGVTIVNPGFVRTPLTDKNDFYMPFLVDSTFAATTICDAIEKGRDEISFPIPFNWFVKIVSMSPPPIRRWIARALWKAM